MSISENLGEGRRMISDRSNSQFGEEERTAEHELNLCFLQQ